MKIDGEITATQIARGAGRVLGLAGEKARRVERAWNSTAPRGAPVFTIAGKYAARGWTEWTQGFQYGIALLAFDGTGEEDLLELGRSHTARDMASHVSSHGVHDHGFNNISTYGNLRRLMREGRIAHDAWELAFYEMAIRCSAGVQAGRWSAAVEGGYIYSFNGPHSLFIDTLRTLRILGVAHQLGHVLMGENDERISLLGRLVTHGVTTARFNIYYGEGRDGYDTPELAGRTAHEAIFNRNDGRFRCPNSQQGYSAFSTWTRGLAWGVLGFAEQLEFLQGESEADFAAAGLVSKKEVIGIFERAARATADFYMKHAAAADGVPYWDTGAPGLHRLGDWQGRTADPFNSFEPVDASAAAIAAQGLLRLGHYLGVSGASYAAAGLTIARTLFSSPYLSESVEHEGLLLHSVYHRPNGWDHVPAGRKVPCGESSMWGDYHLAELALYVWRVAAGDVPYYCFFDAT